jgi:peroxiredoxin
MMKALLYAQVLGDDAKAQTLLKQVKTDYPDTASGQQVDKLVAAMEQQGAAKKIQSALKPGSAFPDFAVTSLDGQPLSVAGLKGKYVMVDFWATWCGPCVAELPNVQKAYEKYHSKGFEIIGVSLDQDKDKLTSFIKEKNMPWAQYFDGLGWHNKLAEKYGIESIPATFLLDKEGKIVASDLRGEALDQTLGKALP